MMLLIYWICFIGGGAFVLLAVLGGLDGVDFESGLDTDLELTPPRSSKIPLLSVLKSLKFWTFGCCFFGLTGIALSALALPGLMVLLIAIAMGLLLGGAIALILKTLYLRQVDSLVRTEDLVGLIGTVELPFDADSKGKVRLQLKGATIDFIAYTDEAKSFQLGEPILVVGTENNRLWVVSPETANLPPASSSEA